MTKYSVSLDKLTKDNALTILYTPDDPQNVLIRSKDINRPGLMLSGYKDYFDTERLQVFGLSEFGFLESLSKEEFEKSVDGFFAAQPAGVLIARDQTPPPGFLNFAEKYKVPVMVSKESTSDCMSMLISYLGVELADRITRHGVLVEVYGEGILIVGNSGVGKSETAVELINRGHRLIADDAVEIRRVSSKSLVGTAPDNIRHYVELRGVGIISARNIFGMSAIKLTEKIDMAIQLELWDENKSYSSLGFEETFMDILGIKVPVTTVPVKPGRNLAIIIECAAMNNRQKRMGFDATKELMQSLGMVDADDLQKTEKIIEVWH